MKWLYYPTVFFFAYFYHHAFYQDSAFVRSAPEEMSQISVTTKVRLPSGLEKADEQKIKDDFLTNLILNYQHLKTEDPNLEWGPYFAAYKKGINGDGVTSEISPHLAQAFVIGSIHKEMLKNNENFDAQKLLLMNDIEMAQKLKKY